MEKEIKNKIVRLLNEIRVMTLAVSEYVISVMEA